MKIWVRGTDAPTLRYWGQGGFGIKLQILEDVLDRAASNNTLVLMVDAYDVLFSPAATVKDVRKRFESIGWPVVIAAESYCVSETCAGAGGKTNGQTEPPQPYLNSGIILGRAGALRQILARHTWQDPLDDQSWWGHVWHAEQSIVLVDSARRIFACPSHAVQVGRTTHAIANGASAELRLRRGGPVQVLHLDGTIASEPMLLHFPGVVRPLLKPAFEGLFSANVTATAREELQDDSTSKASADEPSHTLPGGLLGAPLREGPLQCSRQACWNDMSAALCVDSGKRLVVDQAYSISLDASRATLSQTLRSVGLRAVLFEAASSSSAMGRWHMYVKSHLSILQESLERKWKTVLVLDGSLEIGSDRTEKLLLQIDELNQRDPSWHWAFTDGGDTTIHWQLDRDPLLASSIPRGLLAYFVSAKGASMLVPIFEQIAEQPIENSSGLAQHLKERCASLLTYRLR